MRPSALQLLQHERVDYAVKVDETEKLIANVKAHKAAVVAREREVAAREQTLAQREIEVRALSQRLNEAQAETTRLQEMLATAQASPTPQPVDEAAIQQRVRTAVSARENELRAAIRDREERVRAAMQAREAELLAAVNTREQELQAAWTAREEGVRAAHDAALTETRAYAERARAAREDEITRAWESREAEVAREWEEREEEIRKEVEAREAEVENIWHEREEEIEKEWEARLNAAVAEARKGSYVAYPGDTAVNIAIAGTKAPKSPLKSSRNVFDTSSSTDISSTTTDDESDADIPRRSGPTRPMSSFFQTPAPSVRGSRKPNFKTPLPALAQQLRAAAPPPTPREPAVPEVAPKPPVPVPGSAMRGVVLTSTGEKLATPAPADFVRVFARPLRVKLDFGDVFGEGNLNEIKEARAGTPDVEGVDDAGNDTATEVTPRVGLNGLHAAAAAATFQEPQSPSSRLRVGFAPAAPLSPSKLSGVRPRPASPTKRTTTLSSAASISALRRAPSAISLRKTTSASGTSRPLSATASSLGAATRLKRQSSVIPDPAPSAGPSPVSSSTISASTSNSSSGSDGARRAAQPFEKMVVAPPRKLTRAMTVATIESAADYDMEDEENLPSPFLRKIDREKFASRGKASSSAASAANGAAPVRAGITTRSKSAAVINVTAAAAARRQSNAGNLLRAATANNAAVTGGKSEVAEVLDRPAITSSRRAAELARQRLKV